MSGNAHTGTVLKCMLALLFGAWIAGDAGAQTTYYVNGSCGDDAWTGLSPACEAPDGPKATIQAGLDVAQNGDTVIVADGTYTGPGNKWLWFPYKQNSTLRSENGPENCIIDLEGDGLAFFFVVDEPPEAAVDGFTITNGNTAEAGAIWFHHNSRVIFTNCILTGNTAWGGGAIACDNTSSPTFINCTITGNTATNSGGAVSIVGESSPTFINCTITGNTAVFDGGGLFFGSYAGTPRLINCTIAGNTAGRDGGGILNSGSENGPTVTNSIIWGNSGDQITGPGGITATFSDVQGGFAGEGNIDADPLFVDPASGDYRLLSGSPVIDAADNTAVPEEIDTDLDGNPRFVDDPCVPDTGQGEPPVVDMGAYERQAASQIPGDFDMDCDVDLQDYAVLNACLAGPDVSDPPEGCSEEQFSAADLDDDNDVDLGDVLMFQTRFTGE